jgi:SatD family (SatD)
MVQPAKRSPVGRRYAVLTADVVRSRSFSSFRAGRDAKLGPLSKSHVADGFIVSPYAVTVWDEFQGILAAPHLFPRVILELRRSFFPMELRVAIGIGKVSEPLKSPINQFAGGEAFERARAAMDKLKSGKGSKYRVLTAVESGDRILDLALNTIYRLQDTLVSDVSANQWKTINWLIRTGSQELAAKKLAVNISTVSRTLRRAHYWQIEETCRATEEYLRLYM